MLRCLCSCSYGAHHQNGEDDLFREDGSTSGSRAFRGSSSDARASGCPGPQAVLTLVRRFPRQSLTALALWLTVTWPRFALCLFPCGSNRIPHYN